MYCLLCDSKPTLRTFGTQKLPSQQRPLTVPAPAKCGCKPASHHEPSMIVHLPSSASLASSPFVTLPPWRPKQPASLSGSHTRPMAALSPASDLWSTSSYRPADSDVIVYRAAVGYEGDVRLGGSSESHQSLFNETDRLLHKMSDILSTGGVVSTPQNSTSEVKDAITQVSSVTGNVEAEPAAERDSSEPAEADTSSRDHQSSMSLAQQPPVSVRVTAAAERDSSEPAEADTSSRDHQSSMSLAQQPPDSVRVTDNTASQLLDVCQLLCCL